MYKYIRIDYNLINIVMFKIPRINKQPEQTDSDPPISSED